MKIRILGCHGGVEPEYQTTSFLIGDKMLLDGGSMCSSLTPEQQKSITDILITHPHIDHIKDICFMLENTFSRDRLPLTLHSTLPILTDLQKHIFNDVIWPDFTKIYLDEDQQIPFLQYSPIDSSVRLFDLDITPFEVNHPGNAVGYVLDDGASQVIFSGDTGPCAKLWQTANQQPNLKAVFTEISFPNRMDALARASGHFTLSQLLEDLAQLENREIPVFITHFKPLFFKELLDEFHLKAPQRVQLVHDQDELVF